MASDEYIDNSDAIRETLANIGVDVADVDKITMKHLLKIEAAIEEEISLYEAAKRDQRAHSLSVSSVSQASGVSHATFYNKKILSEYVAARREQAGISNESEKIASLKERLEEAERQVKELNKRDARLVQALIENDRLKSENEILRKRIAGPAPEQKKVIVFPASGSVG